MPGASQVARWADLPQDLVQRCARASTLDDIDRLAIMHTCRSWFEAIAAAPELVPDPVLDVPPLVMMDDLATADHWAVADVLSKAARCFALPIHRMRFTGACGPRDLPQESVLLGALALLPTSLRVLELRTRCRSLLPTALARFSQLEEVHITGDGMLINWQAPGAASLLPKLRSLRLESYDWQQAGVGWEYEWEYHLLSSTEEDVSLIRLPASIVANLAPATALTSLELHCVWSNNVPALVRSLPALRRLGLEVMECTSKAAAKAVALLAELPAGTEVALSVHAHFSGMAYHDYPDLEFWEYGEVPLPPMAAIGATVTALDLVGYARLPTAWRHLTGLQTLSLQFLNYTDMEQPFGDEPLTALTALKTVTSRHSALPAATLLASAPALEAVCATPISDGWRAQLQALRPDVAITDL